MKTGEKLKMMRTQKGWSQMRVAKALDEKYPTCVSRWESGKIKPNTRQLERLAEVFECEVGQLIGSDGASNPSKMDESEKIRALNESILKKNQKIQELEDQVIDLMDQLEKVQAATESSASSELDQLRKENISLKTENEQLKKLMFERWLKEELGKITAA